MLNLLHRTLKDVASLTDVGNIEGARMILREHLESEHNMVAGCNKLRELIYQFGGGLEVLKFHLKKLKKEAKNRDLFDEEKSMLIRLISVLHRIQGDIKKELRKLINLEEKTR